MKKRRKHTVGDYIGSGITNASVQSSPSFTLASPNALLHAKAISLLWRFQTVMGRQFLVQSHLLTFMKLAERFDEWTSQGIEVHPTRYLMAHKWYYGTDLFVTHLLSPKSYEVYESYQRQQNVPRIVYKAQDYARYDAEVLEHLSRTQGESREEIEDLLILCGLV